MITLGGCKNNFQAKVFGGGSVLSKYSDYTESVPVNNIRFTLKFLTDESIPVISSDIGVVEGRKVFFITEKQAVFVKKINTPAVREIQTAEENRYFSQISIPESVQYHALSASVK